MAPVAPYGCHMSDLKVPTTQPRQLYYQRLWRVSKTMVGSNPFILALFTWKGGILGGILRFT